MPLQATYSPVPDSGFVPTARAATISTPGAVTSGLIAWSTARGAAAGEGGDVVGVVHGTHGQGGARGPGGGHRAVLARVAGRDDEEGPVAGAQRVEGHGGRVGAVGVVLGLAEAHVHDVGALAGGPLHAVDDRRHLAGAELVEHLADEQVRPRRDATVRAVRRVARAQCDRGDVRAVTVEVLGVPGAGEVLGPDHHVVQVRVRAVDTRVEHRHRHARTGVTGFPGRGGADLGHRVLVERLDRCVQPHLDLGCGRAGRRRVAPQPCEQVGRRRAVQVDRDRPCRLECPRRLQAERRPVGLRPVLCRALARRLRVHREGRVPPCDCFLRHGCVLHDDRDGVPVRVVVPGRDQARDVEQRTVHPVGHEARDVGGDHVQPVALRDPLERHALASRARHDGRRAATVGMPGERYPVAGDQGD